MSYQCVPFNSALLQTVVKRFLTLIILPKFQFSSGVLLSETTQNQKKMKIRTQVSPKISHSIRNGATAIVSRILHASVMVTKYSYWFLSVFIFFSCQKNLTQTDNSTGIVSQDAQTQVEKFIVIDTAEYSVSNRLSSLSDSSNYRKIQDKMSRFYRANSFKTKWMDANNPNPLCYALFDHLKNASHYGLNPETYRIDDIEYRVNALYKNKSVALKDIIDADIRITETFFLFATHLREGRITDPGCRGKIWIVHNRPADHADVDMLTSAKNSLDLDDVIKKLQPAHDQYARLQTLLVQYRSLEKSELGQLPVSARANIKAGNRHIAIPAIRKKLLLMDIEIKTDESVGDIGLTDSLYYGNDLVSAVKIFQQRHGLEQDGIIGGKTVTYLNQSFKEKADLIAVNMERMRWLPENYATQYIRVNIPEYKLRIYEQGNQTLEMDVIVGAITSATPVFSDTLEHVVLSPTWTVPPSLVKAEFLPRLRRNKMYYSKRKDFTFYRNGVEIDPSTVNWDSTINVNEYRIVQKPGTDNALGLAKFIMPNDMNIYLHDTPDHKPFSNNYRALSHGCIRLGDPAKFAAYLLREESRWDLSNIETAMTSGKPTKIALRKKYQVNLEYNTVWVDDDGNLQFREDIYGHDKMQLERLYPVSNPSNLIASR
jgi:L,D-transpeptidase YcbB